MQVQANPKYIQITHAVSEYAALFVSLIGVVVLCGWIFDISLLKTLGTNYSSMKTNAAICAILSGLALFFGQEKRVSKSTILFVKILAGIVFSITFLTFLEYAFKINFGIDELFFKDEIEALYTSSPNRMSPIASTGFGAFSLFMFLRYNKLRIAHYISQASILFVGFLAALSLANYIFGSPYFLIDISSYTNIALSASIALLLVFISGISLQIEKSFVAVLVSSGKAGFSSRMLLLVSPVAIFIIDYAVLGGHKMGWYDVKYVTALCFVLEITFMVFLIFKISWPLETADILRNKYIADLKDKEIALRAKNEKISSQNEEIRAQNEEYQSLNEELHDTNKLLTNSYAELNNFKTNLEIIVQNRTEELLSSQQFLNETGRLAKVGGWELDVLTQSLYWTESVFLIHETSEGHIPTLANAIDFYTADSKIIITSAVQNAIEKAEPFDLELETITAKGNRIWVHAVGKPVVKLGKVIKVTGTFQEITDKKNAEVQLQRKNFEIEAQNEEYASLNEELIQTNEQLGRAREKAEESDKLKSAFLANMSHEIRTPLNGIMGFSQMLSKSGVPTTKHKMYSDLINSCGEQLMTIIDDLIDISTIEANQVKIQDQVFDLNELMTSIYTLQESKIYAKNIEFKLTNGSIGNESAIITDGLRLRQILINLLNNAAKFTHSGSIEFGYKMSEKFVEFYVKDSGIGIEKNKHELIFERFRQAEIKTSHDFGGNGLGLSISKSLVELLGGKIWVESEYGLGSTFRFTISRIQPEFLKKENEIRTAINPQQYSDKTILIVDDEILNFIFFEEVFSDLGLMKLLHAKNGKEAIDLVQKNQLIDLVLMDLKMPVMDGFEATKELKILFPNIPIIAQSAYAQDSEIEKAMQCGCVAYVTKPINIKTLNATVLEHLKG